MSTREESKKQDERIRQYRKREQAWQRKFGRLQRNPDKARKPRDGR